MNEAQIIAALATATSEERPALIARLRDVRARTASRVDARHTDAHLRSLTAHVQPGATMDRSTSETDWLLRITASRQSAAEVHRLAAAEATRWFAGRPEPVRQFESELRIQATGHAQAWSGQFGDLGPQAASSFMQRVAHLSGFRTLAAGEPMDYKEDPPVDDYDEFFEEDRKARVRYEKSQGTEASLRGEFIFEAADDDTMDAQVEDFVPSSGPFNEGEWTVDGPTVMASRRMAMKVECNSCGHEFQRQTPPSKCPKCDSTDLRQSGGFDMRSSAKTAAYHQIPDGSNWSDVPLPTSVSDVYSVNGWTVRIVQLRGASKILAEFIAPGQNPPGRVSWLNPVQFQGEVAGLSHPSSTGGWENIYMGSRRTAAREIHRIYDDIVRDWRDVNYAARPYLDAMRYLSSIDDMFGADSARSIISYFLNNASSWRGETAKAIKAELKAMLSGKSSARVAYQVTPDENGDKTLRNGWVNIKGRGQVFDPETAQLLVDMLVADRGLAQELREGSRRTAENGPDDDSQSGYAESTLPVALDVGDHAENFDQGWLDDDNDYELTKDAAVTDGWVTSVDDLDPDGLYYGYDPDGYVQYGNLTADQAAKLIGTPGVNIQQRWKAAGRTAGISLTRVRLDGPGRAKGIAPDGSEITFRLSPQDEADLKSIMLSDLAINFSGVEIEESDIIRGDEGMPSDSYVDWMNRQGSRHTAAPAWLAERNNDPYGTPTTHPFWNTVQYVDEGDVRVFEEGGQGYLYHRRQNYWMTFDSFDDALAEARSMNQGLDMWASRRTAGLFPDEKASGVTTWADGYGNWHATADSAEEAIAAILARNPDLEQHGYDLQVEHVEGRHYVEASLAPRTADVYDDPSKPAGAAPQTPEMGHDDTAMFEPGEIEGDWDESDPEHTPITASRRTGSLDDILQFVHPQVGYKTYQVRPGEWATFWPSEVMGNTRVQLYRDESGSGIGQIVETVPVGSEQEAEGVIRRMLNFQGSMHTAMPSPADVGVKVGDIFYCSWGYDQTNIDFYEVVRLTGQGVEVQPIASRIVEAGGPSGNMVVPVPGAVRDFDVLIGVDRGSDKRTKVCRLGTGYQGRPSIVLKSGEYWAYLWDGRPLRETDSMFGH